MPRHFGPQHVHNSYAAMGNAMGRPMHKAINRKRSVADAIAAERNKAAREAARKRGQK